MVQYCNQLSKREGLRPCYSGSEDDIRCDFYANGYRLPTEAEWEYAARGGAKSKGFAFADSYSKDYVSWNRDNSGGKTHSIGQKQPNELGLYDMSGNVWEWCWDWFGRYSSSPTTNPQGSSGDRVRVYRGGGYGNITIRLRIRFRGFYTPSNRFEDLGFRVVKTAW